MVTNEIEPRPYQKEAIDNLMSNDWHGIYEMATGTGKTYTSLFAAREFFKTYDRMFLVILVPFKHLIGQWITNINDVGFGNVIACSSDNPKWKEELNSAVRNFDYSITNIEVVIATYQTASSKDFNMLIKVPSSYGFLIADECHYFGQNRMANVKFDDYKAKLGLSATPQRWFDEVGTKRVYDYFKETVYEFSMKEAIDKNILVNYRYNPVFTDLTEEEIGKYEYYSKKISQILAIEEPTADDLYKLSMFTMDRARIIKKAELKVDMLISLLRELDTHDASHILIYCAEGQLDKIIRAVNDLGFRVARFDHTVKNDDRKVLLDSFDKGEIQILVAINCLDEGVDVPATRVAYFLSSTSNPRQFVQRRGRILRSHPSKNLAEIYDFITIPSEAREGIFESIVRSEIPRIAEFSEHAINKIRSRNMISPYLRSGMTDLSYLLIGDEFSINYKELLKDTEDFDEIIS